MERAEEANLILERSFKMNFIQAFLIQDGEFCQWLIVVKILMVPNCKFYFKLILFSYITFKSCPHLDGKHSVFGKIIKGLDFLDRVECVATNDKDVPVQDIKIEDTIVTVNPYRDTIAEILMKEWKQKSQKDK